MTPSKGQLNDFTLKSNLQFLDQSTKYRLYNLQYSLLNLSPFSPSAIIMNPKDMLIKRVYEI